MTRPERQQTVLDILQDFRGPEPLKQLFWSELNYSRVNTPLSRGKWNATAADSLAADPVLFATGGDGFHIIHSRLPTDKLLMGQERPVVSQLLKEHPYALFVFSNKSLNRWHFLNVKYDDEVTKRRVFRRITIGPGERLRTASERIALLDLESVGAGLFGLSPLDIQARHDDAFNKEPLTKDFFKRFDQALEAIKSDLEEYQRPIITSAEAYTQAQLLLERLIFLYFLQNRGWLNQDDRFLLNHLTEHQSEPGAFTYYSEFLDKLFWTLSSAPGEGGRLPGIPFLNGGLFDDDEFRQPAGSRKTNPPLRVRNATFKSVFGDLLEAFNFTVTEDTPLNQEVAVDPEMLGKVFESIVLHAEAADPDATAPDKRKATGSYYTPRIVVHFICREVLYQYLHARLECGDSSPLSDAATRRGVTADESAAVKSGSELPHSEISHTENWSPRLRTLLEMDATDGLDDEAKERLKRTITPAEAVQLRDLVQPLKCCDPAVGSGAFPVGLLHELVNLRRLLTTAANGYVDPVRGEGSTWLHETKADIVQNCLFGVDIQQQAIEICRLRLWLSMVVDYDLGLEPFTAEKSQFSTAINKISQLPNLEMNFHRGDSLHDHICGVPIVILPDRASRHADAFRAIYKLGERFHKAKTGDTKRKLRLEILEKRLALSARILEEELKAIKTDDSKLDNFFGLDESAAKKRERFAHETEKLAEALKEVEKNREELERLMRRGFDSQFFPKLRKLEGADFNSPFNFAWTLDFPGVFAGGSNDGGFDIIVGNPPFVTARNPKKRELWRERWPRVCLGTYQLVCPFFELGFGSLRPGGQLGFIVSNAFAKREFGKPLVQGFFPTVQLQKIVDCSGLMFPGHGTPTCVVFGANQKPSPRSAIRNIATLPGGGDLRTPPEESQLWHTIAEHHSVGSLETGPLKGSELALGFRKVYEDFRIVVGDCDRSRVLTHPCRWMFVEWATYEHLTKAAHRFLSEWLPKEVGRVLSTSAIDIFIIPSHTARTFHIERTGLIGITQGDAIRDWSCPDPRLLIKPYDETWDLLKLPNLPYLNRWLSAFRRTLGNRKDFNGGTYEEAGRPWYEFHQLDRDKAKSDVAIAFSDLATHAHFRFFDDHRVFDNHSPVILLKAPVQFKHAVVGLLNSCLALFWLKQVCFSKREAEEAEKDTYYEFAGSKVADLPIPGTIADNLQGNLNSLGERVTDLSKACWERGQQMPTLSLKKLFEKPGEAYHEWNSSLPGYVPPNPELGAPFQSETDLRDAYQRTQAIRERLRAEMIALQEEMDWLVYAAYGLLPEKHPALSECGDSSPLSDAATRRGVTPTADESVARKSGNEFPHSEKDLIQPLDQAQRPFRLWQQVEGDYAKAVALIPANWPAERRKLWQARLAAIRDNEHIRRIEQPVYKRRWDEQWKVGNEWRSGPVAYAAEFVDAFEWWLSEKAEWWLEHKKNGGPVELDDWAEAIWKDSRVQAAWPVAAENYALLEYEKAKAKAEENGETIPVGAPLVGARVGAESALLVGTHEGCPYAYLKTFKRIIDDETVPEDIPFAVPYNDLEKRKIKISPKVKSIRGKLNVPRERFHLRGRTTYLRAGL
jgi:type I restriction-modification system DNA methylase subunit